MSAKHVGQGQTPVSEFYERMGRVAGERFFVLQFPEDAKVSIDVIARKINRELDVRVGFVEIPQRLCQFIWGPPSKLLFTANFLASLQEDHPEMIPGFRLLSSIPKRARIYMQ